jgi:hypothetical protein
MMRFLSLSFAILLFKNCSNSAPQNLTQKPDNQSITTLSVADLPEAKPTISRYEKMAGLSFVAIPEPFHSAVMQDLKTKVAANWIAVIPYGYTRVGEPKVNYRATDQWWGEGLNGVRVTIDSAHLAGVKVLLKPQVYVPNGWTGGLDFPTDADWEKWERDYMAYLMPFVAIAAQKNVAALCIGTEFKMAMGKREAFWRKLIADIRRQYKGKLTYAANWDEFPVVPFWDALDFVGINAYMPLVEKDTPSVSEIRRAWQPHFETIQKFQEKVQKPIAFTEYGYMSVNGCAGKGWEVEAKVRSIPINEQAQANALEALYSTFWNEKWWHGGFLWKWFPDGQGHEGYVERDYTPQDKLAEKTLLKWYGNGQSSKSE